MKYKFRILNQELFKINRILQLKFLYDKLKIQLFQPQNDNLKLLKLKSYYNN